ncbi:MAG: hypothetical protein PHC34_04415 [Candidatus Gastranaerophilales bacterium]|nr:hypothetical protein [Candidatus Gastranaerophilales bacterium]
MGLETAAFTSLLFGAKKAIETADKPNQDTINKGFGVVSVFGHASNTVERLDGSLAKGNLSSAANLIANKTSTKAIETVGEAGKYFGGVINGLIICNAGYNVYKDDDKPKALVEQGLKVGGMLGAENLSKALKITEKIEESSLPGKLKHVIAATSFVVASAGGVLGGEALGKVLTGRNEKTKAPGLNENFATA